MTDVYDELQLTTAHGDHALSRPGVPNQHTPTARQPNALPATRTLAHPLLYPLVQRPRREPGQRMLGLSGFHAVALAYGLRFTTAVEKTSPWSYTTSREPTDRRR
jgi:hypothetical protein